MSPLPSAAAKKDGSLGDHYLRHSSPEIRAVFDRLGLDTPRDFNIEYRSPKILVVGAGLMGCAAAIALVRRGYDVTLADEAERPLMGGSSKIPAHLYSGALYCNLGAGTVASCFEDSVFFARWLPRAINERPTVCALARDDTMTMDDGTPRAPANLRAALLANQALYRKMIAEDPDNAVFGPPEAYFSEHTRTDIEALKAGEPGDPWLREWAMRVHDLDALQWPIFLVNEYGLNMYQASGTLDMALRDFAEMPDVKLTLSFGTQVNVQENTEEKGVLAQFGEGATAKAFRHVINCGGAHGASIDEALKVTTQRMQHIKVAAVFRQDGTKTPARIPGYNRLGAPMVHFCPTNDACFVANVTAPDATYVGGPVARGPHVEQGNAALAVRMAQAAAEQQTRGARILAGLQGSMAVSGTLLGTFVGCVDVIGSNPFKRSQGDQACHWQTNRVTSAAHPKGSAVARAAEELADGLHRALAGTVLGSAKKAKRVADLRSLTLPPHQPKVGPLTLLPAGIDAAAARHARKLGLSEAVCTTFPRENFLIRSSKRREIETVSPASSALDHACRAPSFKERPNVDALVLEGAKFPTLPLTLAKNPGMPIALGIARRRHEFESQRHRSNLEQFVDALSQRRVVASTWETWPLGAEPESFSQHFDRVAHQARQIHTNLDLTPDSGNFIRTFGTAGRFCDARSGSPYRSVTADEMHRVLNDPNLLVKTRFYFSGAELSSAHISAEPFRAGPFMLAMDRGNFQFADGPSPVDDLDAALEHIMNATHAWLNHHFVTQPLSARLGESAWEGLPLATTVREVSAWAEHHGFRIVQRLCDEVDRGCTKSPVESPELAAVERVTLQPVITRLRAEIVRAESIAVDYWDSALRNLYEEAARGGAEETHWPLSGPDVCFSRVNS